MWWYGPAYRRFEFLLPDRLMTLVANAYVLALARNRATGPQAGRVFEQAFYSMCASAGMPPWERSGSRSLFRFKSSSGYAHEIDCSIVQQMCLTAWELKNLSGTVPKSDLLIFNSKILDYYQSFDTHYRSIPLYRLLLVAGEVDPGCRQYGVANGIMIIDPALMPIPLLYAALSRGMSTLTLDQAIGFGRVLRWACRPVQSVLAELSNPLSCGAGSASAKARNAVELQAQLSPMVWERIQQEYPEWEGDLLNCSWRESGGWAH